MTVMRASGRRAMEVLRKRGLITTIHRRGTFVSARADST